MRNLFTLLLIGLCGCSRTPEEKQPTENKPIKVAESAGVTVWKVRDGGRAIYYTTPNGQVLQ